MSLRAGALSAVKGGLCAIQKSLDFRLVQSMGVTQEDWPMLTQETAQEGIALLSTAIGMLMEDAAAGALQTPTGPVVGDGLTRFRVLRSVGEDIAVLADAVGVLARRAED